MGTPVEQALDREPQIRRLIARVEELETELAEARELIVFLRKNLSDRASLQCDNFDAIQADNAAQAAEIERLQDRLFKLGVMRVPPCFCCGYNGEGYYQPATHKCAAREAALLEGKDEK
jgi:hypothetical protein